VLDEQPGLGAPPELERLRSFRVAL
jgi:hypothetical protein